MQDLIRILWALGAGGVVLSLWIAITAIPAVSRNLWGWDAPIVGAAGIAALWALLAGFGVPWAGNGALHAILTIGGAIVLMVLSATLLSLMHPSIMDKAGPAAMALMFPFVISVFSALGGLALRWIGKLTGLA